MVAPPATKESIPSDQPTEMETVEPAKLDKPAEQGGAEKSSESVESVVDDSVEKEDEQKQQDGEKEEGGEGEKREDKVEDKVEQGMETDCTAESGELIEGR